MPIAERADPLPSLGTMTSKSRNGARVPAKDMAAHVVRSLVGVRDVQVRTVGGAIVGVRVARDPAIDARRLTRDIASALMATLGLELDESEIDVLDAQNGALPGNPAPAAAKNPAAKRAALQRVVREVIAPPPADDADEDPEDGYDDREDDVVAAVMPAPSVPAAPRGAPQMQRAHSNPARAADALAVQTYVPQSQVHASAANPGAPLHLEVVEVRRHAGRIACRVVVLNGDARFAAVADCPEEPGCELQLAGRVAADAVSAARHPLGRIRFDGAAIAHVGGRTHVVVAMEVEGPHGTGRAIGGAVPIDTTVEHAAARAVVGAS